MFHLSLSLLKCVLLVYFLSVLRCHVSSDAVQLQTYIVKGVLQSREKRDVDILAECDMECKDEKDIKDYEVLLEYDYEDEEDSGHGNSFRPKNIARSCVHSCKIISSNKTSEPETSTVSSSEEVTENMTAASLLTTKAKDKITMHTTVESTMNASTPEPEATEEGSTVKAENMTDSKKSSFKRIPTILKFENGTEDDAETISNFLTGKVEFRIERPVDVANGSTYQSDTIGGSNNTLPPIRLIPKVVRLSVLETELAEAGSMEKPPLVHLTEYSSVSSLINSSMSRILSEIVLLKNLIEERQSIDVDSQNHTDYEENLSDSSTDYVYEDYFQPQKIPDLQSRFSNKTQFVYVIENAERLNVTPVIPDSLIRIDSSMCRPYCATNFTVPLENSDLSSVQSNTNPIHSVMTTSSDFTKSRESTLPDEFSSIEPSFQTGNETNTEINLNTTHQNGNPDKEYISTLSNVTTPRFVEETNTADYETYETSTTLESSVLGNVTSRPKIRTISTTSISSSPNLSYSTYEASDSITSTSTYNATTISTMDGNEKEEEHFELLVPENASVTLIPSTFNLNYSTFEASADFTFDTTSNSNIVVIETSTNLEALVSETFTTYPEIVGNESRILHPSLLNLNYSTFETSESVTPAANFTFDTTSNSNIVDIETSTNLEVLVSETFKSYPEIVGNESSILYPSLFNLNYSTFETSESVTPAANFTFETTLNSNMVEIETSTSLEILVSETVTNPPGIRANESSISYPLPLNLNHSTFDTFETVTFPVDLTYYTTLNETI